MCITESVPRCEDCGEPLDLECERDEGLCVNCQAERALHPTPEQLGFQPLFSTEEIA